MTRFINNPPSAKNLMMSARSFGSYDLPGAIADLIDNSIKANAKIVRVLAQFNEGHPVIRIIDDGDGMSEDELLIAMRPASQNPEESRSPDDLGRFGWGLKSASFSQCQKLTVISLKNKKYSSAFWDLEVMNDWKMGILSDEEIFQTKSVDFESTGTEIIWTKCDRLSEDGRLTQDEFNELLNSTRNKLSLIFHKYLSGDVKKKKINIYLNNNMIIAYDPFYKKSDATITLPTEVIVIDQNKIKIIPYVLPHYSKLERISDQEKLEGDEGMIKNQGFYVYRNNRLIINGTWFKLAKYGEFSQLIRIEINLPNTLDKNWKITIDKSGAELPIGLKKKLSNIINIVKNKSFRVYRKKGGKIDDKSKMPVWNRHAKQGEITYKINREHPVISSLEEASSKLDAALALQTIEQNVPIDNLKKDTGNDNFSVIQTDFNQAEFLEYLKKTMPIMLDDANGDFKILKENLKKTSPFEENFKIVEEYLIQKKWV